MSTPRAAAVSICAVLLAGCGASVEQFRAGDPTGYRACQAFADSRGAGGGVRRDALDQAASLGLQAETPGISAAVDDRNAGADGAPVIGDLDAFEDACTDAGYPF